MHQLEIRQFENGNWREVEPPEWFSKVTRIDGDWGIAFEAHGIRRIEKFNEQGDIDIFKAPDGMYCVIFGDSEEVLSVVFIESASDYIRFRAQYIAPLIQLATLAAQLEEHEQEKFYRQKAKSRGRFV